MYFCGEPEHAQLEMTLPAPVVGVRTSVPPVAPPSFESLDSVTVITPFAPTLVLATNWVGELVPEQPAAFSFPGNDDFEA